MFGLRVNSDITCSVFPLGALLRHIVRTCTMHGGVSPKCPTICPYKRAGVRAGICLYKRVGVWVVREPDILGLIRPGGLDPRCPTICLYKRAGVRPEFVCTNGMVWAVKEPSISGPIWPLSLAPRSRPWRNLPVQIDRKARPMDRHFGGPPRRKRAKIVGEATILGGGYPANFKPCLPIVPSISCAQVPCLPKLSSYTYRHRFRALGKLKILDEGFVSWTNKHGTVSLWQILDYILLASTYPDSPQIKLVHIVCQTLQQ